MTTVTELSEEQIIDLVEQGIEKYFNKKKLLEMQSKVSKQVFDVTDQTKNIDDYLAVNQLAKKFKLSDNTIYARLNRSNVPYKFLPNKNGSMRKLFLYDKNTIDILDMPLGYGRSYAAKQNTGKGKFGHDFVNMTALSKKYNMNPNEVSALVKLNNLSWESDGKSKYINVNDFDIIVNKFSNLLSGAK